MRAFVSNAMSGDPINVLLQELGRTLLCPCPEEVVGLLLCDRRESLALVLPESETGMRPACAVQVPRAIGRTAWADAAAAVPATNPSPLLRKDTSGISSKSTSMIGWRCWCMRAITSLSSSMLSKSSWSSMHPKYTTRTPTSPPEYAGTTVSRSCSGSPTSEVLLC